MTPEQQKNRLGDLIGMMDSNQVGEREAALNKAHAMGASFAELWRRAESAVSPEVFEKVEKNVGLWKAAFDAKEKAYTAVVGRNAALVTRNATLRAALFAVTNWRKLFAWCALAACVSGGAWFWRTMPPAPDALAATASADDSAFHDVLRRMPWDNGGDSAPMVVTVNGAPWWVMARSSVDRSSHVNARGEVIERHCLQLFADEATRDSGAFLTPRPYALLTLVTRWKERAAECRMPGERNYQ